MQVFKIMSSFFRESNMLNQIVMLLPKLRAHSKKGQRDQRCLKVLMTAERRRTRMLTALVCILDRLVSWTMWMRSSHLTKSCSWPTCQMKPQKWCCLCCSTSKYKYFLLFDTKLYLGISNTIKELRPITFIVNTYNVPDRWLVSVETGLW